MLQVSTADSPRYKQRNVSAIRHFPRGCGPKAVKLNQKPEQETSFPVGFENFMVVETGRVLGAPDVGEEPVVPGLVSALHPEMMEHPNSLISDVLVNNTAETNPEEVKLEVDDLVKEVSESPKLQNGNCYSKLYRTPKRRKVSAFRQFPPGCGPNAGRGSKDGYQLVGAAPTFLKADILTEKKIDEANKSSVGDGSLGVAAAEIAEVQTRRNDGNEVIQENGERICGDHGIRPQISSPKSKISDGEKRKHALGHQEGAGGSALAVASTKLQVPEHVPLVKQPVMIDRSTGIADTENSLNSDMFIVKQVTSVGGSSKISSAERVGFMNRSDSKVKKGNEKSFKKSIMARPNSHKNFVSSEVQGTSAHVQIKSSLKSGSKGNLFVSGSDKMPEAWKGDQVDGILNKANASSPSHLVVKSQFRSKDNEGGPLGRKQSIKENELNREGSNSVKRKPSAEILHKERLPDETDDSLDAYGDRMIIQALMATESCPWRNSKRRASSSGLAVPKSKIKSEKGLVDRKSASMCFSFSQHKNKGLIEDDDDMLEEEKNRKALTVCRKQNELSITMTPFVPDEFSQKSGDNEIVARHKVKRALRLFQLICRKLLQGEESRSKRFGKANRIDLQASSMLKENGEWVNSGEPVIGHVPGVEIGDEFHFRVELSVVGLHRPFQGGIDYTKKNGIQVATSIVASGGYQDDMDSSDVLIYSGSGGNTGGADKQPGDQKLERGNLALKNSIDIQLPVRVIHGFKEKGDSHDARGKLVSTFTYDGLYLVEKYWQERGPHGFNIFKFQLRRKAGQPELPFKELKRSAKLKIREGLCVKDISQGKEKIPISVVNTLDADHPMPFEYTIKRIYPSWYVKTSPRGCDCTDGCSDSEKCACAVKNGGEIPYNFNGAIVQAKPLIYECGPSCKCSPSCHNRVSQHGIRIQLEIFKTRGRGWGVRSLKSIPSGSFICEYIGELLQDGEAEQKANDDYLFDIGNNYDDRSLWENLPNLIPELQSSSVCDTVENVGFTIDAAAYGNIGRFINHSCSPNLYAQNVLYDHDDKRVPHIMLFAVDNIPPLQELTYHYNYTIDQVHDSEGKIKQKACHCGSPECCGRLY